MTVNVEVTDITVGLNSEITNVDITLSLDGGGGEVTKATIDEAIGASDDGAANKFYNEQGEFIEIESGETTTEAVHKALGISDEGLANKFLNEQGEFIEIESGETEAEFKISVMKKDCKFKGDWIKISHTEATNAKRVIVRRATVEDSNGEQELDLIVAYPAAETYTCRDIYKGFYIQDRNGLLSKTADWDVLNFDYDIEPDTEIKYSFLNHETGINVISSHRKNSTGDTGNEMHAMSMRAVFTSVFPEFEGDYIDTYIDPVANYSDIFTEFEPTYYEKNRASIMMKPYTYAALSENYSSSADFLEVGSHSDNARNGNPPFRVDITPKADVLLSHSIAVGAKKENDWQTAPQTNFGYGVEFFEITKIDYLEAQYTERGERIYPHMHLQLWSNADRTVVWTEYAPHQNYINSFPDCFKVGDIVFINVPLPAPTFNGTHSAEWTFLYNPASVKRTITAIETIDGVTYFTLDGAIWDTQLNGNKYLWAFTPAAYAAGNVNGSTQSPATMIVGAKFAKIKQATGLGLRLIREACRATAVLINGTTTTTQSYSGATTTIEVESTAEFPDEGIIMVNGYDFVYTSKTASSFVGESQTVVCSIGATVTLKWDMYRGFGQINVDAAIAYLETNYIDNDDYKATIQRPKVNPALSYEDLGENDCVPKCALGNIETTLDNKITLINHTVEQLEGVILDEGNYYKGDKGDKGDAGRGIASIDLTNTNGKIKTYTITFTDNTTTTYTVIDGNDGASPVITFVGTTIYVNGVGGPDLKGEPGAPGQDGAPGSDAEVTNQNVIAAIGFTPENVSNKKTTLTDSDTDYPTTKAVNTGLADKQTKSLKFTDTEVPTTAFVADTTYADYGYKAEITTAEITTAGVTSADIAEVVFAPTESDSGNFAGVAATGTDTVTIYAKAVPSATITIPTILIFKL